MKKILLFLCAFVVSLPALALVQDLTNGAKILPGTINTPAFAPGAVPGESLGSATGIMRMRQAIAAGDGEVIAVLGDSIAVGTGATNLGWIDQTRQSLQSATNGGAPGLCTTENQVQACSMTFTGTWTSVSAAGPNQSVGPSTFAELKTGSNGATASAINLAVTTLDVLYYNTNSTTASACAISVDSGAQTATVGASEAGWVPHIRTFTGLSSAALHTVTVTSDGTCNLLAFGLRADNVSPLTGLRGLNIWNFARGGATTQAFGASSSNISMLSVIPNLAGVIISLGQNDAGYYTPTQSLGYYTTMVNYIRTLSPTIPIFFVFTEQPQGGFQGNLNNIQTLVKSNLAAQYGYPWISIYDRWTQGNTVDSYVTYPNLYFDTIHPSQIGHNDIANAFLTLLGFPRTSEPNKGGLSFPYGSFFHSYDSLGNALFLLQVLNGNDVQMGGNFLSRINIRTGNAGANNAFWMWNDGKIGLNVSSENSAYQLEVGGGPVGMDAGFGVGGAPASSQQSIITGTPATSGTTQVGLVISSTFPSGATTATYDLQVAPKGSASTTVATNGGILVSSCASGSGGSSTTCVGVDVATQGAGSTNYGIRSASSINLTGGSYQLGGKLAWSTTAPTISSGFGTSPSIVASNGTAAFTVNVGTGGTATSGVIGLPTASTGWACYANDVTTTSTTVFLTKQTATTTTSATFGNFTTAGVAGAWAASDVLQVRCTAY